MRKYLEVIDLDNKVVKRMDVSRLTEREADRTERGLNQNMNHEQYFTRIIESNIELPLI